MGKPIPGGICGVIVFYAVIFFGACCGLCCCPRERRNDTQTREIYANPDRYQSSNHAYIEDNIEYVNE
jgi:hypothetical protein